MATRLSVKEQPLPKLVVGVIASPADLRLAQRLRKPPDLFELRLDHFPKTAADLENGLAILNAPLIITARHPREGGANDLSTQKRRELLLRFLPYARYVDIELRSAKALRLLLDQARRQNVGLVISYHDLDSTPTARSLRAKARAARSSHADIFKVATRTDSPAQLARLRDFMTAHDVDLAISAMGIGKLGLKSRREFMRRGSVLNYAYLGRATIGGQPSLAEIRRWKLSASRAAASRRRVRR
jgi:3-dehydroquinate dehydratase I